MSTITSNYYYNDDDDNSNSLLAEYFVVGIKIIHPQVKPEFSLFLFLKNN